jgi:hypothetical protein
MREESRRMSGRIVAAVVTAAALLGACGDGSPVAPAGTAEIAVSNQTSGDMIDTDGYRVRLDGDSGHGLPVGGSIVLPGLDPGDHRLELTGLAPGCAVSGLNPRIVPTQAAATAQSLFLVTCTGPGTGRIVVRTYTYGDPEDDYLIEALGGPSRSVGAKDEVVLHAIQAGPVTLFLGGTGACAVIAPNPRTIQVGAGETARSLFKINCVR